MFNIKPKEDKFFELFIKAADNANKAALALNNLMLNYDEAESILQTIVEIETTGDNIKYEVEKMLLDSFITPFDREDIYLIAKKIDRFVNNIQTSALRFKMLHIDEIAQPAKDISNILVFLTEQLVILMKNLNNKKNARIVKDAIIKMNKLESEVDQIFRDSITQLFDNPQDLLKLIKWKEIYQHLEDTADACEEIANSIEGVVTKNE